MSSINFLCYSQLLSLLHGICIIPLHLHITHTSTPCFLCKEKKRGKTEEVQRKVGVVLLNGQKLELSCDVKAVCKDVLDMVVAHVGLVEHHLFSLAYLSGREAIFSGRVVEQPQVDIKYKLSGLKNSLHYPTDNEFYFVDPDAKLSKVAPEGWKDDPKKKKVDMPFNLFLRIKFFLDDVNLIQ